MDVVIHGLLAGVAAPFHDLTAGQASLCEKVHGEPVPEHMGTRILGFICIVFESINTRYGIVPASYLDSSLLYGPFRDIAISVFPYFKELIGI